MHSAVVMSGHGQILCLGGAPPVGSLSLVYMRRLDTGRPCAALPRVNGPHEWTALQDGNQPSLQTDNASRRRRTVSDRLRPPSASPDKTPAHVSLFLLFRFWSAEQTVVGGGMTVMPTLGWLISRESYCRGKSAQQTSLFFCHLNIKTKCLEAAK